MRSCRPRWRAGWRRGGHIAEHVADLAMAAAPDHQVREYAAGVGAVIVTKDEDFAVWHLLGQ